MESKYEIWKGVIEYEGHYHFSRNISTSSSTTCNFPLFSVLSDSTLISKNQSESMVSCVLSFSELYLLIGYENGVLQQHRFDVEEENLEKVFSKKVHIKSISSISKFDSQHLVSSSCEGEICFLKLIEGGLIKKIVKVHVDQKVFCSLCIASNVLLGCNNGDIITLNSNFEKIKKTNFGTSIRCMCDTKTKEGKSFLFVAGGSSLDDLAEDRNEFSIRILSTDELQILGNLECHESDVNCLVLSTLFETEEVLISSSDDRLICIWNLKYLKLIIKIKSFNDWVTCLETFSNAYLISGYDEQDPIIWNLEELLIDEHCEPILMEEKETFILDFLNSEELKNSNVISPYPSRNAICTSEKTNEDSTIGICAFGKSYFAAVSESSINLYRNTYRNLLIERINEQDIPKNEDSQTQTLSGWDENWDFVKDEEDRTDLIKNCEKTQYVDPYNLENINNDRNELISIRRIKQGNDLLMDNGSRRENTRGSDYVDRSVAPMVYSSLFNGVFIGEIYPYPICFFDLTSFKIRKNIMNDRFPFPVSSLLLISDERFLLAGRTGYYEGVYHSQTPIQKLLRKTKNEMFGMIILYSMKTLKPLKLLRGPIGETSAMVELDSSNIAFTYRNETIVIMNWKTGEHIWKIYNMYMEYTTRLHVPKTRSDLFLRSGNYYEFDGISKYDWINGVILEKKLYGGKYSHTFFCVDISTFICKTGEERVVSIARESRLKGNHISNPIIIWDLESGKSLMTLVTTNTIIPFVNSLLVSNDNKYLVTVSWESLFLWDLETFEMKQSFCLKNQCFYSLCWVQNFSSFFSFSKSKGENDVSLILWNFGNVDYLLERLDWLYNDFFLVDDQKNRNYLVKFNLKYTSFYVFKFLFVGN